MEAPSAPRRDQRLSLFLSPTPQQHGNVVFTVDAEHATGRPRISNEEIADACASYADVLIPFASVDPWKGQTGVNEVRGLVERYGMRGFKFHPSVQGFSPNDAMAYPLYEAIEEAGAVALFHTGQTGSVPVCLAGEVFGSSIPIRC